MIRPALALLATLTIVVAGCATTPPPPPPKRPRPIPPPRRGPLPRASTPAPTVAKGSSIPARVRCKDDDDCEISTFRGCCSCCKCAAKPYAVNKLFSQAQRNSCNAVDCAPCAKKCAPCGDLIAGAPGRAACIKNRCTRVVDNKGSKRPMGAFEGYE